MIEADEMFLIMGGGPAKGMKGRGATQGSVHWKSLVIGVVGKWQYKRQKGVAKEKAGRAYWNWIDHADEKQSENF